MLTKDADIIVQNPSVQMEKKDEVEKYLIIQEENVLVSSRRHTKDYKVDRIEETPVVSEDCEVEYEIEVDVDNATIFDSCIKGLSYIMGYIAKKFYNEFPHLGSKTSDFPVDEIHYADCPWVFHLSKGGLVAPSWQFLEDGRTFEHLFNEYHGLRGNVRTREDNVLDNFTDILCKEFATKYDRKVLALFSKTRTMIRLKDLNLELKQRSKQAKTTRDYKQLGQLISKT